MEFGNFRFLGQGGSSVVYLADDYTFARQVAVKVLGGTMEDPTTWVKLERECALAGQLSGHVGAVTLYAAGQTETGGGYIVMEYLPAGSLARLLRARGAFPATHVALIGRMIADLLEAAHAKGIVHRDVKPENILLTSSGQAKLGDFGISALLSGSSASTTSARSYTPDHVAPEVLRGRPAGPHADVYSLCSTMYQLLTGTAPHRRADDESLATLLTRKISEPAPPLPSTVPSVLAALVAAGLDSDPSCRPTASELLAGLAAVPVAPLWAEGDAPSVPTGPAVPSPLVAGSITRNDAAATILSSRHRSMQTDDPSISADEPPQRRRRRRAVAVAAAAVVLLGAGAAVAAARPGHPQAAVRDSIIATTTRATGSSATTSSQTVAVTDAATTVASTAATSTTEPEAVQPTFAPSTVPVVTGALEALTPPVTTVSTASSTVKAPSTARSTATTSAAALPAVTQAPPAPTTGAPAVTGTTQTSATTAPTPVTTTTAPAPATPAPTPATPAPTVATTVLEASPSTVARATFAQGDANRDGIINCGDVAILTSPAIYGSSNPVADFNGDGIDNVFDLSILLAHFTPGQPTC